jgi:CMP-N,N'-diacetyllegionaminic acid synthase
MIKPRVLATIPARGGSKSVPHKNIYNLGGKPLIAYTIEEGLKSEFVTDLIVSTDNQEISKISKKLGAQVPFIRPAELSSDSALSFPVVKHAIEFMENEIGFQYDYHVMLQPTSPFRKAKHIDDALSMMIKSSADSIVSVSGVNAYHPLRMKKLIGKENYLVNYIDQGFENMKPRQVLPSVYIRNGAIYISSRESLFRDQSLVGPDCRGFVMDEKDSINIDSLVDMKIAEHELSRRKH